MQIATLSLLLTVIIFVLVPCQSACKTVTGLTAEAMVEKAYAATGDIMFFHISMCNKIAGEDASEQCMEGDFQFPDRMRIVVDIDGEESEFRIIGDRMYTRDLKSDEWQVHETRLALATQASLQRLAELAQPKSIAENLKELEAINELQDEVIDGVSCVHYRGMIDPLKELKEKLAGEPDPFSKGLFQDMINTLEQMDTKITIDFWIGKADYLVRQQQIVQSWNFEGTAMTVTTILRFTDFNKPVEIEPPL